MRGDRENVLQTVPRAIVCDKEGTITLTAESTPIEVLQGVYMNLNKTKPGKQHPIFKDLEEVRLDNILETNLTDPL